MQEPTDPRPGRLDLGQEPPRCGHCDEVVDPTLHLGCPTCGAYAHDHCLVQHGGCPTPGCEVTGPVARPTEAARTLPPVTRYDTLHPTKASRARIWTSAGGAFSFSLGAGGIGLSLVAAGSPGGTLIGAAGIVIGATLVVLGTWLHSLVTLLAPPDTLTSIRPISAVLATVCLVGGVVGMFGASIGVALLDASGAIAEIEGLRRVLGAGLALVAGAGMALSGGLNLAVLGLDSVRRDR